MGKGNRNRTYRAERPVRELTPAEEKAMHKEINRQILIHFDNYWKNLDACVLWSLHTRLGFDPKRLKQFFLDFNADHLELRKFYEIDDTDGNGYVCRRKLEECGVDLDAWEREAATQAEKGDD